MSEEAIKKHERALTNKTVGRLNKESFYCGPAYGKLADVATAMAKDKGLTKIVKSVYEHITQNELNKLLYFDEFSDKDNVLIELWFWRAKEREPFTRKKLFYNKPNQRISTDLKKLVK